MYRQFEVALLVVCVARSFAANQTYPRSTVAEPATHPAAVIHLAPHATLGAAPRPAATAFVTSPTPAPTKRSRMVAMAKAALRGWHGSVGKAKKAPRLAPDVATPAPSPAPQAPAAAAVVGSMLLPMAPQSAAAVVRSSSVAALPAAVAVTAAAAPQLVAPKPALRGSAPFAVVLVPAAAHTAAQTSAVAPQEIKAPWVSQTQTQTQRQKQTQRLRPHPAAARSAATRVAPIASLAVGAVHRPTS